jgi:flavin-binding protein dodecin
LNSKEIAVTDHVYQLVELVGSSTTGIEDAIERAIAKTSDSVRHMRWFEVEQIRGHLENGKLSHYQVTIKAGFTLEDEGETLQP